MDKSRSGVAERLRILWAIASKDIADAVRNKLVLSIVLGLAMLMLSAQAFPLLLKISARPRAVVYDEGRLPGGTSRVISALAADGTYDLIEVDSRQAMEEVLVDLNAEVLGLTIPAGLDERLASGAGVELGGAVVWSRRAAAGRLAARMEEHLAGLLHRPVRVKVEDNLVFPPPEGSRSLGMLASVLALILATTGGFLVPYLIFEEKQTHTMDALLCSPASAADIILGKAGAGVAFCLTAMAVVLAFNHSSVASWAVAVAAVLVGAVLAVGAGLLMGSLFESAQQMGAWTIVPIALLAAPVLCMTLGNLPAALSSLLPWLPTVALGNLFLLSFSGGATAARALPVIALVVAWSLPLYAAVIWIVRRSDR